ncbi:hypothetical protein Pelo_18725 [Pelomyxa schiedti]|nr:hypothetical protein Pelo_18725 [Pelomyxa schiedti]
MQIPVHSMCCNPEFHSVLTTTASPLSSLLSSITQSSKQARNSLLLSPFIRHLNSRNHTTPNVTDRLTHNHGVAKSDSTLMPIDTVEAELGQGSSSHIEGDDSVQVRRIDPVPMLHVLVYMHRLYDIMSTKRCIYETIQREWVAEEP